MQDTEVLKQILVGLVRAALIGLFGWFVKAGYVSTDQLSTAAPIVAGLLIVLGTIIISKLKQKYRLQAALRMAPDSTMDEIKEQGKRDNPLPDIIS